MTQMSGLMTSAISLISLSTLSVTTPRLVARTLRIM